jgi:large subunit ribosomal protein L10
LRKQEKIELAQALRKKIEESPVMLLTNYRGLTVEEISEVRRELKKTSAEYKVIKNRLMIKALEGLGLDGLEEFLSGPIAVAFHKDDPVSPARVLVDFAKEHENLEIRGGAVEGGIIDADGVTRLSKLPGREELRSDLAGQINTLLGTVVFNIDALFQEFAGLLDARSQALEEAS